MGKTVNKAELSEIIGVSQRTLTTWQKNGMPIAMDGIRGTENLYDTAEIIDWMIQREIQRRITDHGGDEDDWYDFEKERARLTYHQANIAALDEQVKETELISAETVCRAWCDLTTAFSAKVRSIPTKAAHNFIRLTDINQIQDCLKVYLNEALTELSNYDPEQYGIPASTSSSPDGCAASGPESL